jgi:hypothetical protein
VRWAGYVYAMLDGIDGLEKVQQHERSSAPREVVELMQDQEVIPAYFVYLGENRRQRLLCGDAYVHFRNSECFLVLEFEEAFLIDEEAYFPVSLVYGERAEREVIGDGKYELLDTNKMTVSVKIKPSKIEQMFHSARSFSIGF